MNFLKTKKLCIIPFLCFVLCLASCGTGGEDTEPSQNIYVFDESEKASVNNTVNLYITALKEHNHSDLSHCTTSSFKFRSNETMFTYFVNGLSDAELQSIDYDNARKTKDGYSVNVSYTLTYTGSYTDENGNEQSPGKYSRNDVFKIDTSNGGCLIEDITHAPVG